MVINTFQMQSYCSHVGGSSIGDGLNRSLCFTFYIHNFPFRLDGNPTRQMQCPVCWGGRGVSPAAPWLFYLPFFGAGCLGVPRLPLPPPLPSRLRVPPHAPLLPRPVFPRFAISLLLALCFVVAPVGTGSPNQSVQRTRTSRATDVSR